MKICFFSARPLGLQGTPGTYLFLKRIVRYVDALVVSPFDPKFQVYPIIKTLPWVPVENLSTNDGVNKIVAHVSHFDPDILYVFNFPEWPLCIETLKRSFGDKKIILDIKTPLLAKGERRKGIQRAGQMSQRHLDYVVTLSRESVQTWIPGCNVPIREYPLGIDISLFPNPAEFRAKQKAKTLIYVGSLHVKRNIDGLIDCFSKISCSLTEPIQLDLYGRGNGEDTLRKMAESSQCSGRVFFKGLLPQLELFGRMPNYDAGIAWVPVEIFSHSPSLKALEYMAAGLPVLASNTRAHQALKEQVDLLYLFDNAPESFREVLRRLQADGFPLRSLLRNREAVEQFDYGKIIEREFLPLFERLCHTQPDSVPLGTLKSGSSSLNTGLSRLAKATGNVSKPPLKLFFICNSLADGKGGAERVAMETAVEMGRRGHVVYMAYANKGYPSYERGRGVVLFPFDSLGKLSETIETLEPDVCFVFYFDRMLIHFYSLVHNTAIPFGMQECTNPERLIETSWCRGLKRRIPPDRRILERESIGAGAHCIRLTMPRYAQSFPEYIRKNVRAFSNPAFPQRRLASPGNNNSGEKIIINVGGMKASKNLMALLKAFAPLAQEYPEWIIKVFGKTAEGSEPHKIEIREFIKAHGLKDRVFICGPTDDIFSEFAASHIHVISSLSEGCPTTVLEAMATGVPTIGFADCPGTNELIRDGENGLLASAEDRVRNLGQALQRLMECAELRGRLGQQAWEDSKAFSPGKIYDQWEQMFYEAAEYKDDPERLFIEQIAVDPERAVQSKGIRENLVRDIRTEKKIRLLLGAKVWHKFQKLFKHYARKFSAYCG